MRAALDTDLPEFDSAAAGDDAAGGDGILFVNEGVEVDAPAAAAAAAARPRPSSAGKPLGTAAPAKGRRVQGVPAAAEWRRAVGGGTLELFAAELVAAHLVDRGALELADEGELEGGVSEPRFGEHADHRRRWWWRWWWRRAAGLAAGERLDARGGGEPAGRGARAVAGEARGGGGEEAALSSYVLYGEFGFDRRGVVIGAPRIFRRPRDFAWDWRLTSIQLSDVVPRNSPMRCNRLYVLAQRSSFRQNRSK